MTGARGTVFRPTGEPASRFEREALPHLPRLYPAALREGSIVREVYGGVGKIEERHRHRYEVNNAYRDRIAEGGLVFSGTSPDGRLVEFIELPRETHPYFVATQAHPELRSRPTRPHPLFVGLVAAAVARSSGTETAAAGA